MIAARSAHNPLRHRLAGCVAAAAVAVATAGCGTSGEPGPASSPPATESPPQRDLAAELDGLTAYDPGADLDLRPGAAPVQDLSGVLIEDVSWASAFKGRVTAWLVQPPASVQPPYAGLVYLHGSESDRDDLRDEAVAMAQAGAVSLVLNAPFARPNDSVERVLESYDEPELERDMMAHAVVDVRQAYDLLSARADVDPSRLGYVGHSWGAAIGIDVAAEDERPVAFAVLSARPSWTGFLRDSTDGWVISRHRRVGDEAWSRYLEVLAPFDALAQVGRLDGAALLLQYGEADDVVPPDVAQQLVAAAPDGTTTQTLPGAEHGLDADATDARCSWLSTRLGLPEVPAAALAAVGLPE